MGADPAPVPFATLEGVRIYRCHAPAGDAALADAAALLAPEERARADAIVRSAARAVAVHARAFLRRVLAVETGDPPAAIALAALPDGKPVLAGADAAGGRALHFNLSHSADLVVVAVSRSGPVGVDVERPRPLADPLALARQVATATEVAAIAAAPDPPAAFLRLWCAKEAVMKADGRGFRLPPAAIALAPVLPDGARPAIARFPGPLSPLAVHPLAIPGATAALAVPAEARFTSRASSLP